MHPVQKPKKDIFFLFFRDYFSTVNGLNEHYEGQNSFAAKLKKKLLKRAFVCGASGSLIKGHENSKFVIVDSFETFKNYLDKDQILDFFEISKEKLGVFVKTAEVKSPMHSSDILGAYLFSYSRRANDSIFP